MIKPELEFVYEAEGSLGAPIPIGDTPQFRGHNWTPPSTL
jgi:hypothetical protein